VYSDHSYRTAKSIPTLQLTQ